MSITANAYMSRAVRLCRAAAKAFGQNMSPQVVTLLFIAVWYGLNIAFNLKNKTIFNYFPFPYTVSAIHVVVGAAYCGITYLLGFKEASFGRVSCCCVAFGRNDFALSFRSI